ncbi:hypothetical protein RYZ26_06850 [Terasakiella sp. A23]|uniref:hypothetical protein n=1 Tax=Terasakiella sp. FCG-A23 TaxID=3080561 RepID=UPI002952CF0D|nr:hypothetical protein [Terasakiella sp. A23]MDV7339304.1 hypothetical protein [Terasakiella sp. A23]
MDHTEMSLDERIHFTPVGIKAYIKLMDLWQTDIQDRWDLLGGTPPFNLERYQGWDPETGIALTEDQLLRIGVLIKIAKSLHMMFGPQVHNEWVRAPNASQLTKGISALRYMVDGGLPAIIEVHKYLLGIMQCHYL